LSGAAPARCVVRATAARVASANAGLATARAATAAAGLIAARAATAYAGCATTTSAATAANAVRAWATGDGRQGEVHRKVGERRKARRAVSTLAVDHVCFLRAGAWRFVRC
jgi:hypothetical protein